MCVFDTHEKVVLLVLFHLRSRNGVIWKENVGLHDAVMTLLKSFLLTLLKLELTVCAIQTDVVLTVFIVVALLYKCNICTIISPFVSCLSKKCSMMA